MLVLDTYLHQYATFAYGSLRTKTARFRTPLRKRLVRSTRERRGITCKHVPDVSMEGFRISQLVFSIIIVLFFIFIIIFSFQLTS